MKTTVNAVINLHKILVSPIVISLMWYYDNWSSAAFFYLGLHGTYTVLWLIKQNLYPDKRFEQQLPVWIGFLTPFLPLAGYYLAPYLLISNHTVLSPWVYAAAPLVYTIGIFLHYVSDAQKHYTLNLKKGLIENGLFKRTRNPNYLGEILIYGAFALLSWHWLPLVVLGSWIIYFFVNMAKKDRSMARHEGFEAYSKRTGKLLPKLFY
jgi:protein-S-isoprenylcysteine O-methyltransferase Ste14